MNSKVDGRNPKLVFVVVALLFALSLDARAQQVKIPRIGFVPAGGAQAAAFRRGLRDMGYTEGKDILVEYRYIEGQRERIPSLVAELVRLKVDVLVLATLPTLQVAKAATSTIPIVMVTTQDPVATGLVDSFARPGGNVTGLTRLTRDLSGKRMELLKEVIPRMSSVGVLWDAGSPGVLIGFKEYESAARTLKLEFHSLEVRDPNADIEGAFQAAAKKRVKPVIAVSTVLTTAYQKQIVEFAIKNRVPLMAESRNMIEAGGLMSYSADDAESFRRAAVYVDKILKGAKPADLPVEQPTKFEFVINLNAAKQIGLTIPPNVLARAYRLIR